MNENNIFIKGWSYMDKKIRKAVRTYLIKDNNVDKFK